MREIKFRGKRLDTGTWVYGSGVLMADDYCVIDVDTEMYEDENYEWQGATHIFRVAGAKCDTSTLGQFTSLKDKNGKEIYEGDIIAFNWTNCDGVDITDLLEVRFVRGVFAFLWEGDLDHEANVVSPTHEWANVIGNIHDNPDLIKNN